VPKHNIFFGIHVNEQLELKKLWNYENCTESNLNTDTKYDKRVCTIKM